MLEGRLWYACTRYGLLGVKAGKCLPYLSRSLCSGDGVSACDAQEYVFRGIQKGEWLNLFNFIRQKRLRIENLQEAEAGPQGPGLAGDLGADIDTGEAHQGSSLPASSASSLAMWLEVESFSKGGETGKYSAR